jgi:S1-C subfamily serine protease
MDVSYVLLAVVLVFFVYSLHQLNASWGDAARGIILFERAQRDEYIDTSLIALASRMHPDEKLADVLRKETVLIARRDPSGHTFEGAGVIVGMRGGDLEILTARHVLSHPGRTVVIFPSHLARYVHYDLRDRKDDLALVYVRAAAGTTYSAAPLASADFIRGQQATIVGHPGGVPWVASSGVADPHLHETLIYCPSCNLGDSGGGAFDAHGRLHGMIVRKYVIAAPATREDRIVTVTAFSTVRPDRIRAFLAASR